MSSSRNRSGFRGSTQILAPLRLSLCLSRANITFTNNGKEQQMMKVLIELMASSEVSDNNNNISNTNGALSSSLPLSLLSISHFMDRQLKPARRSYARSALCWLALAVAGAAAAVALVSHTQTSTIRRLDLESDRLAVTRIVSHRIGSVWIGLDEIHQSIRPSSR